MSQQEIFSLLEKNPRLTTKEIAELLNENISKVSTLLNKMLKNGELKADKPTAEEEQRILKRFPNSVSYGGWRLKVFFPIENEQ